MEKLFSECTCPQCKKTFICWDRGAWAYRAYIGTSTKFFCTWKCLQAYRRDHATRPYKRRDQ